MCPWPCPWPPLTWIRAPSTAGEGAMPSLAEADTVIASEASSAAAIRTKRLIWFLSRRVIAIRHKFPTSGFVPAGPKLNPQCDIRASGATYSRLCAAVAHHAAGSATRNPSGAWRTTGSATPRGVCARRLCTGLRPPLEEDGRACGASGAASAKASRGERACGGAAGGRSAAIALAGTMVGRLVSITILSGHLRRD
jgi:hypothetical protein